jgi:Tfp pilus assembly protein PilO
MKQKKVKIVIALGFIFLILGVGFAFYRAKLQNRKTVKKQGYRTHYNPSYIDSMVRAKRKKH